MVMNNKAKILYVDDELINLTLFEINFSKKYEVSIVDNGMNGLEILDKNPDIKVVVSDMKMPNMDGIEFIRKAKEKHPDIKFYVLTGFEITKEIREALNSKLILKYFMKPFNMKEIDKVISEAIG
jgi:two-component system, response regulator, stage 0 sporulation protein F